MSTRQDAQLPMADETRQKGSEAMSVESSKEGFVWSERTKVLAAGFLLVAVMAACLVLAAQPAHASTTFTVNFNGDFEDIKVGDGVCDASTSTSEVCTLRAAIQESNATAGADTINFNIPVAFRDPDTGVATIKPTTPLPPITDQVTINGYTQPGSSPNTLAVGDDASLKIELDGTNLPNANENGLDLSDSSGSVIKGLVINLFPGSGIAAFVAPGESSVGNRIEGNFIGTNPTGTLDEGNASGGVLFLSASRDAAGPSGNVVGGTTPAARNVISGNGGTGISIGDASADTLIKGNYVGTDKSGTKALGNDGSGVKVADGSQDRIPFEPSGNIVGGTTAASRNVVSGNHLNGIEVFLSRETKVLGNRVGTTAVGTGALGNDEDGVSLAGGIGNLIGNGTSGGSNTVAFNGDNGVEVYGLSAEGIEISRNSVFSNAGIGIDLGTGIGGDGPTLNDPLDPLDADEGPNDLQNKPVLSSAKTVSGKTTINGKLQSNPGESYTIAFYSNPKDTNEGKKFIGEKSVTTTVDGLRSFTFTPANAVAVGQAITATATLSSPVDPVFEGHDTSEFSAARKVASS